MVSLTALWLPILGSAIGIFIVSSVLHMVFKYHTKEYGKLPDEDGAMKAMRDSGVSPGFYSFPHATCGKDMQSEEVLEKFKLGPVGTMNVIANGVPAMGPLLGMWFVYSVVVSFFAAYLASRTLDAGTSYLAVFRVVGAVSFMAYSFGHFSDAIWKQKPWSMALKHVFDGLVYALVTAGVFGWLWP